MSWIICAAYFLLNISHLDYWSISVWEAVQCAQSHFHFIKNKQWEDRSVHVLRRLLFDFVTQHLQNAFGTDWLMRKCCQWYAFQRFHPVIYRKWTIQRGTFSAVWSIWCDKQHYFCCCCCCWVQFASALFIRSSSH